MVQEVEVKALSDVGSLRQVLQRVKQHGDQYILKENGEPEAVLLSMDDLELLKRAKADKQKAWDSLFATLRSVHARNAHFSAEEVEADVDAAIKEIRQGRA